MMFATALTVALFVGMAGLLASMFRNNGDKIAAALRGESFASVRPALVNPADYAVSRLARRPSRTVVRVDWRAAA